MNVVAVPKLPVLNFVWVPLASPIYKINVMVLFSLFNMLGLELSFRIVTG